MKNGLLKGTPNLERGQGDDQNDDSEYFEINVLGIIKFRCKRVTAKAIIALILLLIFAGIMIKL